MQSSMCKDWPKLVERFGRLWVMPWKYPTTNCPHSRQVGAMAYIGSRTSNSGVSTMKNDPWFPIVLTIWLRTRLRQFSFGISQNHGCLWAVKLSVHSWMTGYEKLWCMMRHLYGFKASSTGPYGLGKFCSGMQHSHDRILWHFNPYQENRIRMADIIDWYMSQSLGIVKTVGN